MKSLSPNAQEFIPVGNHALINSSINVVLPNGATPFYASNNTVTNANAAPLTILLMNENMSYYANNPNTMMTSPPNQAPIGTQNGMLNNYPVYNTPDATAFNSNSPILIHNQTQPVQSQQTTILLSPPLAVYPHANFSGSQSPIAYQQPLMPHSHNLHHSQVQYPSMFATNHLSPMPMPSQYIPSNNYNNKGNQSHKNNLGANKQQFQQQNMKTEKLSHIKHSDSNNNNYNKNRNSNQMRTQSKLNTKKLLNNKNEKDNHEQNDNEDEKKFDLNGSSDSEKSWPSLKKYEEIDREIKESHITDQNKMEKVLKNVNFLKVTIEQHYLNENKQAFQSHSHHQQQQQPPNKKLSFREMLLSNSSNKKDDLANVPNVVKTESPISNSKESLDDTNKKKSSKQKKNIKSISSNEKEKEAEAPSSKSFDIFEENFPALTKANSAGLTYDQEEHKLVASNGTQSTNPSILAEPSKVPTSAKPAGQKKSRQPIQIEFASMISALERGQNELKSIHRNILSGKNTTSIRSNDKLTNQPIGLVNPLDSTSVLQKRGKERETRKQKKPSTLKKIILKEREEKRRAKQDPSTNPNELSIDLLNALTSPNSLSTALSPRHNDLNLVTVELNKLCLNLNTNESISRSKNSPSSSIEFENKSKEVETVKETGENLKSNEQKEEQDTEENNHNNSLNDDEDPNDDKESVKTFTLTNSNTETTYELQRNKIEEHKNENDDADEISIENEDIEEHNEESVDTRSEKYSQTMSPLSQGSPLSINGFYSPSVNFMTTEQNLISLDKLEEQVKKKIHSRKFREYCNQIVNKDIDEVCLALLHEIVRFQDRLYHKNPIKAKIKRRYVMGIREVTKHLKLNKLKGVILAPNCEKIESKGGLDDAINTIIQKAIEQNVPFVFALGRKSLGKAVNKLVPISVVGIFDYSGAEEYFKRLVELANQAKLAYQDIVEELEKEECEVLISQSKNTTEQESLVDNPILPNSNSMLPRIPSHMAHSRTPSNGSNISIEPYFHLNYHTHSRSASGTFNYGMTTSGHTRTASGGGMGTLNIDLASIRPSWTHSRTPSNCSNISFISRLSEPISEVGSNLLLNLASSNTNLNSLAAVQYYTEQVRLEMRDSDVQTSKAEDESKDTQQNTNESKTELNSNSSNSNTNASNALANLHLGCINELDTGNEADSEESSNYSTLKKSKPKLEKIKSESFEEEKELLKQNQITAEENR